MIEQADEARLQIDLDMAGLDAAGDQGTWRLFTSCSQAAKHAVQESIPQSGAAMVR
jgi:hypothetical protein